MFKAVLSPLQKLAARSKSPMLSRLLSVKQDWEVLPDGQLNVLTPMTRPALAHKLLPLSPRALARAPEPVHVMSLLKAAQEAPPRDAAGLTGLFVSLAAGRDSLTKQHTNHPGWRAMVRALNKEADISAFSAEQAVSIISAAGRIGTALPAGTITSQAISQLTERITSAHSTFPASACAGFMQGLTALKAFKDLRTSAAEAFLDPWLEALTGRPGQQLSSYPVQLLGVLEACARHGTRLKQEYTLKSALVGTASFNDPDYDLMVSWLPGATHRCTRLLAGTNLHCQALTPISEIMCDMQSFRQAFEHLSAMGWQQAWSSEWRAIVSPSACFC